ncbi:hypothetical protein MMC13_001680 [Lambiella insularis]|nr:hypothetical protein [Lambiella insularis]
MSKTELQQTYHLLDFLYEAEEVRAAAELPFMAVHTALIVRATAFRELAQVLVVYDGALAKAFCVAVVMAAVEVGMALAVEWKSVRGGGGRVKGEKEGRVFEE